jgi:hypothetical protein
MLAWRDVQSEADPTLANWLAAYERSFPIEVLLPRDVIMAQISEVSRAPSGENDFHVTAAMDGEAVVGGAMFTFLGRTSVGLLSYIFTGSERRGNGIGTWLYDRVVSVLRADATRRNRSLRGLVSEVEREDLAALPSEREERIRRLRFFTRVGARILAGVNYLQPPLHSGEEPLPMYLMFDAVGSGRPTLSSRRVLALVADIYRVAYVNGAGLSEYAVQECLERVRQSIIRDAADTRSAE